MKCIVELFGDDRNGRKMIACLRQRKQVMRIKQYWRKGWARSVAASAFFAVMTTVAMAGVWEIVEWLYAVIDGGEAGAAFLGSQGDEWDAQKDILCDTLGALCSAGLFMLLGRKEDVENS